MAGVVRNCVKVTTRALTEYVCEYIELIFIFLLHIYPDGNRLHHYLEEKKIRSNKYMFFGQPKKNPCSISTSHVDHVLARVE